MILTLDIDIRDERWRSSIEGLPDCVQGIASSVLSHVPFFKQHVLEEVEISMVFADDAMITELNKSYRDKDRPTNVLSFPQVDWEAPDMDLPVFALGDEVFAFETIAREAEEQDKTLQDHTAHLIVHGLLHLCGYDHMKKAEAEIMESLEIKILAGLSINNPYQS